MSKWAASLTRKLAALLLVLFVAGGWQPVRSDENQIPLQGRIEQIAQPDASLPLSLTGGAHKNEPVGTFLKLKTEQAKLDTQPSPLQGSVSELATELTYPDFFVGTWGGLLKILSRIIDKPDPTDAHLIVGESGAVVFRFVKASNNVAVRPAAIFFRQRAVSREDHLLARDGEPKTEENLQSPVYFDYPVIALGSKHWRDKLGMQWDDLLLHNSLTPMGTSVAEQDVVFQRTRNGKLYGYRETVVRFHWRNEKNIFAEVAVADYATDRTPRKRTFMAGHITPNWQKAASSISKFAGEPWDRVAQVYGL